MRLFRNRISGPSPRWAFWRWFDITLDGRLYLTRLNVIQTPWFSVKLHWIHRPDPDRHLHDHPWPFYAFVLKGGYREYVSHRPWEDATGVEREVKWFNTKDTITGHRISSVKPGTVTLIFAGPRRKGSSWGFYIKTLDYEGNSNICFMNWNTYTALHEEVSKTYE